MDTEPDSGGDVCHDMLCILADLEDHRLRRICETVLFTLPRHDIALLRSLKTTVQETLLPASATGGHSAYTCFCQGPLGGYHVALHDAVMDEMSDEACQWAIAHELAHIVLRHDEIRGTAKALGGGHAVFANYELIAFHERQANYLAHLWGYPMPGDY